ncbi:MAG: branched-chain amino acid ABC transporter permease [Thermodesulfovibrionales bacterium]|nr:branched-chain amino acid ABC transporter permease [Thermodesulfovibrionales bacterium]
MFLEVLFNGISLGTLYCLITVGFAFTYNVARFFDISQGAAFLFGGYLGYQAVNVWHMGLFPGFLLALFGSGVFGAVVDLALITPLRKRAATPLVLFIATLGLLMLTQSLLAFHFGSDTKVYESGASLTVTIGNISVSQNQIRIAISAFALIMLTLLSVRLTAFGRRIRAIADSQTLSAVVGIPVKKVIFMVFIFASALSGIGGFFFGLDKTIDPNSGMSAVLVAMIASIIGGVGNILGAIAGALVLGIMGSIVQFYLPGEWKYTTIFIIFIIFAAVRKQGILGIEYRST